MVNRRSSSSALRVPMRNTAERPRWVSEERCEAKRLRSARAGRWMLRSSSPGSSTLAWLPVTKSIAAHFALAPIAGQEGVAGFECGGERHHRACRQRHADIAADRSGVPDLERGKKGAGAELKQGRRGPFRRRKPYSSAMVQVAAMSRPVLEAASEGQRSERRSMRVSVAICGVENSQVPPASQA